MNDVKERLKVEVARRRTFAIISHPDAGKTTLTEKLLLYGGAMHLAGSVKQRRDARHATSDWMALERERGISITTSVLQFAYRGYELNLLDTPGHNDFSEDTYRTLAAADCAIMLIDSAKGVEPQTIKLFEVCRMRRIPIVTFVNKMDRDGRDPLDLLDEIERVLGIPASPATWPIGSGAGFQGVYDRWTQQVLLFERGERAAHKAAMQVSSLDDPAFRAVIGDRAHDRLSDALALLHGAGTGFDHRSLPQRRADAGVLRQRLDQLRRRAVPRPVRRAGAAAAAARDGRRPGVARRAGVLGLRLQDSGEHGSAAPRPCRLRAGVLRALRARHGSDPRAHRQAARPQAFAAVPGAGTPPHRGGLRRRHCRRVGPRPAAHRRLAERGRGHRVRRHSALLAGALRAPRPDRTP